MSKRFSVVVLIATLIAALAVQPASAITDCVFLPGAPDTMTLQGSCTTTQTILIPEGFTLDGQGYTIAGVDPAGGHFLGAVLKNEGNVAHITNVTVSVLNLANACDSGVYRLRGILLESASGSVTNSFVMGINQGNSGCQEGNAIEIRNLPFDGTHPNTMSVVVSGNVVSAYQKTGIVANGDVSVEAFENIVTGFGPVNFIAQNGIQYGYGAMGSVHDNSISGNDYSGTGWTSAGLLMFDVNAADVKLFRNSLRDNQKNLSLTEDSACPNMYGGIYSDWGLCD